MSFKLPGMAQNTLEFYQFIGIIKIKETESYLEIGSRHGGSLYRVAKNLPIGATVVSIDLPNSKWGSDKSKENLVAVIEELKKMGYDAHLILGDSKSSETIKQLSSIRQRYDAIFVDGDHTYDGVKSDYDNYFNFSKKIFAFHDIIGKGKVQVSQIYNDIKKRHTCVDIIEANSNMGIGVIIK